jgi:signal recognition particle receptor subunit beta
MPTIDPIRGVLVIRIVYDGPALSGKTTSLRALAKGVGSEVACPEEREGRTLFFDWVDYVGGLYEGRQIRCQIISVPGQRQLADRRARLLEDADAVVCVLDTSAAEIGYGLEWLTGLVPLCRGESPPVGIVLQANKRDAPDAVPRAELRERVDAVAPLAIVESVATGAEGIREAFVLAVRLALDRVRALSLEGRLAVQAPEIDGPEQLLGRLQRAENAVAQKPAAVALPQPHIDPVYAALRTPPPPIEAAELGDDERLFVPDPLMPGGMIWPPVDGRAHLHEVARLDIRPYKTPRGDWWASASGWRFHSSPQALFADHDQARDQLIVWARLHTAYAQQLSTGRVVILAEAGRGRFRLWQIVRVEALLREQLASVLAADGAENVATGLVDIASRLSAAREWFEAASARLPCTLWTISASGAYRPAFAGLMPDAGHRAAAEPRERALIVRELAPHVRDLRRARVDYQEVWREVASRGEAAPADTPPRWLASVIAS